jgi:hypothetical protein
MRFAILLIAAFLSGCVINQTQYFVSLSETQHSNVSNVTNTSTKTIKETPASKPVTVVIKETKLTPKQCAPFILPLVGDIPSRPIFSDPELRVQPDIDTVLAAHIRELKAYSVSERDSIEDAYREWLKSCR